MRLARSITAEEACKDINPRKAPRGTPQMLYRRAGQQSQNLGWYRGHQAGLYDAYLTLKAEHPRIAEKFRKAAGLDCQGNLGM